MRVEPTEPLQLWNGPNLLDDPSIVTLRRHIKAYLSARTVWRNTRSQEDAAVTLDERDAIVFHFALALEHGLSPNSNEASVARSIIRHQS